MGYTNINMQFNFCMGSFANNWLNNFFNSNFIFGGWRFIPPVPKFVFNPFSNYFFYPPVTSTYSAPYTPISPPPDTNAIQVPKVDYTSVWDEYESTQSNCCTFTPPKIDYTPNFSMTTNTQPLDNYTTGVVDRFESSVTPAAKKKKSRHTNTGNKHQYSLLPKSEAEAKAKKDPNLENISSGGAGWSLCSNSFRNDIPYARKGTKELLDRVYRETGIQFWVTSALGTKTSPHGYKDSGYESSHYNHNNPKLDLQPKSNAMSRKSNEELAAALNKTGLFERVYVETDKKTGATHLDVQFKESAYSTV